MSTPVQQSPYTQPVCPPAPRPKHEQLKLTDTQRQNALVAHHRYQANITAVMLERLKLEDK